LRISQLCDKGLRIIFDDSSCIVVDKKNNSRVLFGFHENNVYIIDMMNLDCNINCLSAINEDYWLWHRQLVHVSFDHLSCIDSKEALKGIPKLRFKNDRICDACQLEKQIKSSFKSIKNIMTSCPLELIHMDLFGLTKTKSLSWNHFVFVLIDDFSWFT